jgi:hypothetical protein
VAAGGGGDQLNVEGVERVEDVADHVRAAGDAIQRQAHHAMELALRVGGVGEQVGHPARAG